MYSQNNVKAHRQIVSKIRLAMTFIIAVAMVLSFTQFGSANAKSASYTEPYRPQFHYSPAQNWMNDPNGLIYYKGEYHMFYQYNPYGATSGNGSWGHAVSKDLVHWKELPVAIPTDANEDVWSGSVVFDKTNSSGLGTAANPPLVAVYTSYQKSTGIQRQALAYSTDGGTAWTKYAGNPVIDIGSHDFRDPKVFWYAPTKSWRMVVALSTEHKVAIYTSTNLRDWSLSSEFGPAGITSAVWECPDLFPMTLNGNKKDVRWVLTVNVSGKAEYFVGDFNGKTFTDSEPAYTPPTGQVLNDFEGSDYGSWQTAGTAFGSGPAKNEPGPTGYLGNGLADSYHDGDNETGTLTSPEFTINQNYLNFLIAGGNHPYSEDASTAPPSGTVFEDFEGSTLPGWTGTGDFTALNPSKENLSGMVGSGVLDTYNTGDSSEGTLTSPTFTIHSNDIDFLIAGGNHPESSDHPTAVNLIVDGKIVASATGNNSGAMDWKSFDVSNYQGRQATLQIVDQNDGSSGWGHIMVDDIVFSNVKAGPWDSETGVNLLVNGKVVRTATGNNSGNLDWASWNLKDLQGQKAQIQIVDHNTGDWGHILADQFTLADKAATNADQRAHWIDEGQDYYAAVTFNDAPAQKRIMVGWMNNWNYANDIPTSPWRGAQALPRELKLQTIDGTPQITSEPVHQAKDLDKKVQYQLKNTKFSEGTTALGEKASGIAYRLDVTLTPKTAADFGVNVRTGNGAHTAIGYDTVNGQLYLDRTKSGNISFNSTFPSIERANLPLKNGKLSLQIYVDWSSVEVFANGGRATITDQIFPDAASNGIQIFSTGGSTFVNQLKVTAMPSIWNH